jgi:SAM-dependent methyltransferase
MLLPLDVRRRVRTPEVMDQPDLDERRHRHALRGLARLNSLAGVPASVWPALLPLLRQGDAPSRLLDVAAGAGDNAIRLWKKARRNGLRLEVAGCDISPTAIKHARENAAAAGAEIEFFTCDVLTEPLPDGFDIVVNSLFLHHLDEEPAEEFLRRAGAAARKMLLVSDLRRCVPGLVAAWAAARLLTRSPVVHTDAPLSVRAAFTIPEAEILAARAGLRGASIRRAWPFRFLLTWRKET